MTNAQAATVAHDLIVAGYQVHVTSDSGGNWTVLTQSTDGSLTNAATAQAFATAHGVTADASQFTLL